MLPSHGYRYKLQAVGTMISFLGKNRRKREPHASPRGWSMAMDDGYGGSYMALLTTTAPVPLAPALWFPPPPLLLLRHPALGLLSIYLSFYYKSVYYRIGYIGLDCFNPIS